MIWQVMEVKIEDLRTDFAKQEAIPIRGKLSVSLNVLLETKLTAYRSTEGVLWVVDDGGAIDRAKAVGAKHILVRVVSESGLS